MDVTPLNRNIKMHFVLCTVSFSMEVLFFILFCRKVSLPIELLMKILPIVQKSTHLTVIKGSVQKATSPAFRTDWV